MGCQAPKKGKFWWGYRAYIDGEGVATPTANGIIHYSKDGIHIVPERP
ncbi:polymorphic toxin type 50 domain-containing protein [Pseudomonas gregormendelii]